MKSIRYTVQKIFKKLRGRAFLPPPCEIGLKKSECFVISFDESLNEITQSCEMDLLFRYFDHLTNKVRIRYFDSRFFGHGTHKDLVTQFQEGLKDLDPNKMFQISMDGPNVNIKFLEEISRIRKADEQHQLINIGSCGLHIIHGSLKTGAEKANWKLRRPLKQLFKFYTILLQEEKIMNHKLDLMSILYTPVPQG